MRTGHTFDCQVAKVPAPARPRSGRRRGVTNVLLGTLSSMVLRDQGWMAELSSARVSPGASEGFDRIAALASRLLGYEVGLVSGIGLAPD